MPSFPEGASDVCSAPAVDAAVRVLQSARELAVDVEADAMHAFHARLCFVQLGTDIDVFLFDTLVPGVRADALAPLFADASRTKFFHAAGGDLQYLAEAGVRVNGLFDTHRAATLLGWPKVGLADLALERLGIVLPKEHQQSDFSIRPLPTEVHQYIANDVRYLCEIGRQVREECAKADVLEEVSLDCQRLADEAAARPDLSEVYPKVPRGGLSPAQVALATAISRALHLKRLAWAEAANVPMGRMLSNAAIGAIATRLPADLKALAKSQGVRGEVVRKHGEEVLALVKDLSDKAKTGELPPLDSKQPSDPGRRKREEALKQWRAARALDRKVTPSVVLPNGLVDELSSRPPVNVEDLVGRPYVGEKRARLYGVELVELLAKR